MKKEVYRSVYALGPGNCLLRLLQEAVTVRPEGKAEFHFFILKTFS